MKQKRLLSAIILLLISMHCYGKPKIVFDYTSYDFGNIKKSSSVSHVFKFYNRGTSTLLIERVKAG